MQRACGCSMAVFMNRHRLCGSMCCVSVGVVCLCMCVFHAVHIDVLNRDVNVCN